MSIKRRLLDISARNHFTNRQMIVPRKRPVTFVVRRHGHDRAGPITHQHIIGNPNRQTFMVHRIDGIAAGEDPGLFLVELLPLQIAFLGRRFTIGGDLGTTEGRGVDVVVDAVGDPAPLAMAISLCRDASTVSGIGAYAGKGEVPLGLAWLKGLQLRLGLANVIAHVDRVLALIEAGKLDPVPLVTHHMKLDEAAEAYEIYDNREALKIVLTP